MKALLSHDQTAIWPRLCLRDEFCPRKKVGICCPNATVSGNIIIKDYAQGQDVGLSPIS